MHRFSIRTILFLFISTMMFTLFQNWGVPKKLNGEPFVIFLSPKGNDVKAGRSSKQAVKTLSRAMEIIEREKPTTRIIINIKPGHYYCAGLTQPWTYSNGEKIFIQSSRKVKSPAYITAKDSRRPVFHGVTKKGKPCKKSVWFTINHRNHAMNIVIRTLKVTRYRGAISITGKYSKRMRSLGISIVNNVFLRIGDRYYPRSTAGKGAILLSYSQGIRISGNIFHHIRNKPKTDGLIHSIYYSSFASDTLVDNNVFHGNTGSIIKLSNYSNYNTFVNNSFSHAPTAIVDRWCGAREDASKCRDGKVQCPSWGNSFSLIKNQFSNLAFAEPAVIYPTSRGEGCGHEPLGNGVRMDFDGRLIY